MTNLSKKCHLNSKFLTVLFFKWIIVFTCDKNKIKTRKLIQNVSLSSVYFDCFPLWFDCFFPLWFVAEFPRFGSSVHVSNDYQLTKLCCTVMAFHLRLVKQYHRKLQLLQKSVRGYVWVDTSINCMLVPTKTKYTL